MPRVQSLQAVAPGPDTPLVPHDRQALAPVTLEYVPFPHRTQAFPPGGEYLPTPQVAHTSPRISSPPVHLHPLKPVPPGLTEFGGHNLQSSAPWTLHMLIGHRRQAGCWMNVGLNVPSGQGLHSPSWRTVLPGQGSQVGMPSLVARPVGQGLQDVAPVWSWNVRFGQGWHCRAVIPAEKVPSEQGTHCTYVSVIVWFATTSTSYWISMPVAHPPFMLGYSPAARAEGGAKGEPSHVASITVGSSRRNTSSSRINRCTLLTRPPSMMR